MKRRYLCNCGNAIESISPPERCPVCQAVDTIMLTVSNDPLQLLSHIEGFLQARIEMGNPPTMVDLESIQDEISYCTTVWHFDQELGGGTIH